MPKRRREQRDLSHQSSPCSSGKSASSEPGGSRNKGSVSCLQDISRGAQSTQTEELAQTSKIPDRVKAPLASRCQRRRKRRTKRVTDRVSNGSTHGEARKKTQTQGILKRKMKHLSRETNTDRITDTKRPSGVWTLPSLEGATAAPHLSVSSASSWETEEEETDDDPSNIRRDKHSTFIDLLKIPRIPCPECFSLKLRKSQCLGGAPVYRDGCLQQQISQPERERSMQRRASPTSPAFTFRPSYWQSRSPVPVKSQEKEKEEEEEKDVQTPGTSIASTLQFSDHACATSTSAQIHNPNVDAEVLVQECEEDPGGAAAAENTHQHLKDSSEDIVCRPKQRPSVDLSTEEDVHLCRICYSSDNSSENPLVSPCKCSGSVKYIHLECLKSWTLVQLQTKFLPSCARFCELCGNMLKLDLATFDLEQFCSDNTKEKKGALRSLFHYIRRRFRRMREWRNPRPPDP